MPRRRRKPRRLEPVARRRGRSASTSASPPAGRRVTVICADEVVGERDALRAARPPTPRASPPRTSRAGRGRRACTPIGCRATRRAARHRGQEARTSPTARGGCRSTSSTSMPAARQASANASARRPLRRQNAPTRSRAIVPVCAMTPGSPIVAAMYATPPSTCAAPSTRRSAPALPTPFWNGIADAAPATSGAICAAAVSTSHSLTQNITTSTGAMAAGSSVASGVRELDVAQRRSHRQARARASRRGARRARRT